MQFLYLFVLTFQQLVHFCDFLVLYLQLLLNYPHIFFVLIQFLLQNLDEIFQTHLSLLILLV